MHSFKYRVREDSARWLWEVFTDDGHILASGSEPTQSTARAAAMLAVIRGKHSSEDDGSTTAVQ